jgi:hypothetical protein
MSSMIGAFVLMAAVATGPLQGQLEALLGRAEQMVKNGQSAKLEQIMSPAMVEMWQGVIDARKAKAGTEKQFATLLHNWFSTDRPMVRFVQRGEHAGLLFRENIKLNDEPVVNYSLLRFQSMATGWKLTGLNFQVGNKDTGFDWSKYPDLVGAEAAEPAPGAPASSAANAPGPTAKAAASEKAEKVPPADLKARCESVCTLLLHYPFEELERRACEICRPVTDDFCEVDFPFNHVPECTAWDELRNCIYARHGRPFKAPEWRKVFEKAPWYKADPTYTDDRLSPTAKANVRRLIELKKARHHCR